MNCKDDIKRGAIFFVEKFPDTVGSEQQSGRPAIIVSNDIGNYNSDIVEVVYLTTKDKPKMPTHVSVMALAPSTALCENIDTVSQYRLGDYIRTLTDDEMKRVEAAMMVSLGIKNTGADDSQNESNYEMEIDALKNHTEELHRNIDAMENYIEERNNVMTIVETERNIYREYCERLFKCLESTMGVRNNG